MKPKQQLPVFYINLDSRPDRRQFMEEQFARLSVQVERVSARTIADVPTELIAWHDDPGTLWPASPGDLACSLSHHMVWRRIVDENLPAALIFEDDALIEGSLGGFLQADICQRLAFDLLKLETRRNRILLGERAIHFGGVELRELQSSMMGAAAYIITRPTAQASLAHPLLTAMAVDRFLFGKGGPHLLRSRILQAVPAPVIQMDRLAGRSGEAKDGPARSDISPSRRDRRQRLEHLGRRSRPNLGQLTAHNAAHAAKLVRLATREPGVIGRRRRAIPFAGD